MKKLKRYVADVWGDVERCPGVHVDFGDDDEATDEESWCMATDVAELEAALAEALELLRAAYSVPLIEGFLERHGMESTDEP